MIKVTVRQKSSVVRAFDVQIMNLDGDVMDLEPGARVEIFLDDAGAVIDRMTKIGKAGMPFSKVIRRMIAAQVQPFVQEGHIS